MAFVKKDDWALTTLNPNLTKELQRIEDGIQDIIENNLKSIGDSIITNVSVGEANIQNKDKIGLHFQTKKKSSTGDSYEDGDEIIVDLDKEKFLSNAKLDEDGHTLELTMNNNDVVKIDLSEILTAQVIDQKIEDAIDNLDISPSFDHETGTLSIGKNNSPANLAGVVHSPEYASNKLTLKVYGKDSVEVNFDKLLDNKYISSVSYYSKYPESGEPSQENVIVFKYSDESNPLVLPVGFLMDKYTASNEGRNIEVTINGNEVSASLVVTNSGQTDGAIMVINKDGTLIAKSSSDVVDEAVTRAIIQALSEEGELKSALDKKLDKLANGSEGEIIVSTSDGIERSGKTIEDLISWEIL